MVIVFGGSFNPPTFAHLEIVKTLLNTFKDSTVLLLPVGNDYQKPELIDFSHRFNMLTLMTKHLDRVIISELESQKKYNGTLESLKELSKTYKDIFFVIGSDNLVQFETWINYQELLKSYPFIIMMRKTGLTEKEAEVMFSHLKHQFIFVPFDVNIQSSQVRKSIQNQHMNITKEVFEYIQKNHLYGA
jgi:nicotinate-nucleotide adenylyltransferase